MLKLLGNDPPPLPPPHPDIYKSMGEQNIYKMMADFYSLLEKSEIGAMFSDDLIESSKRSALFFIGLLGGPQLYHQKINPPDLLKIHKDFPIYKKGKDTWINCFFKILEGAEEKYNFPREHLEAFKNFLEAFASWLINSPR